jgi:hypothetical protein
VVLAALSTGSSLIECEDFFEHDNVFYHVREGDLFGDLSFYYKGAVLPFNAGPKLNVLYFPFRVLTP